MDVFNMLKQEHDEVKKGLQKVMRAMDPADSGKLRRLCADLERHMAVEEEVVYPRLRKIDEISGVVTDGFEEHKEIKDVLKQLKKKDMDVESCEEELHKLKDLIEHHIREEETRSFEVAARTLSESEIDRLTEKARDTKETFKPSIVV